jgi:hypothetical protein
MRRIPAALLRARRERPRRRTAEETDELAPFHRSAPPVLSTERIAHSLVCQDTAALRDFNLAYVACGL